jgi:type I restriction enzyme S subunit
MDGLNMGIIKEMPLPVPERAIQQEFISRMKATEGLSVGISQSRNELDELFAALQSRAFTGQL